MSAIPSEPDGIEQGGQIPDVRRQPIGSIMPSASLILKRMQKKGAEVPVAAFQSSI